jgi:hypothetical protein
MQALQSIVFLMFTINNKGIIHNGMLKKKNTHWGQGEYLCRI